VVSLLGGYASMSVGHSDQSYVGTDDDIFTYQNDNQGKDSGFVGTFIGLEWVPATNFFMEAGVEYDYFGSFTVNGSNLVGVERATSTPYDYDFQLQSQQVIAVFKLLYSVHHIFHPYASVGLGAAFNRASDYSATTSQTGSINITPTFESNTETAFSYNLSLGFDMDVASNVRVGLAYRFSNLGHYSLDDGTVTYHNYQSSVPFTLSGSNIYANQFLVDINFLI